METIKPFRLLIVKASLLLTLGAAALSLPFDFVVAKGILLGGFGSTLGFWVSARNLELENATGNAVTFRRRGWFALRMLLYALVLFKAYSLDAPRLHGFIAAAGGSFAVRAVVTILGLTGWDLKKVS